jgi:citrate lyase beta subunit
MSDVGVRISAASPEADLSASVWPGVTSITLPRVESVEQLRQAEVLINRLERRRGIRPGTVRIQALIASTRGVTRAPEIASVSSRVDGVGLAPAITLELGEESLVYARSECELQARAHGVAPLDRLAAHD